jgi:hypothetical protein
MLDTSGVEFANLGEFCQVDVSSQFSSSSFFSTFDGLLIP